jgi:hypothetical protein
MIFVNKLGYHRLAIKKQIIQACHYIIKVMGRVLKSRT